ncbi:GGDEF domain-containing protein [Pseudomonas marincola]|uniref:GGDEF domain-containing protein n=1 Tax=Pseudomonas marincola TaxID=437900 RepID=UPI0008E2C749|nr:GGDEF domain-containing protein [Pseudomonas marincola]SFU06653.1 diguanylate cyclase (GGDEF) domain-containing protein [Pseudomonas marincola]
MKEPDVPSSPRVFVLWREAKDTQLRARLGGCYYLSAWLLVWLLGPGMSDHTLAGLTGSALFFGLMQLRKRHTLPVELTVPNLKRWLNLHWAIILASAFLWGATAAWARLQPSFDETWALVTLMTIAFSTVHAFSFSMNLRRARLALLMLYIPTLLVMLHQGQQNLSTLITLMFYLSFLLLLLSSSHREYRHTLAIELQLIKRQEALKHLSLTDSLTQLGNRLKFDSLLANMMNNAKRQGVPLSLVMLDIDHFKSVNDRYGHSCGDICLVGFADVMRNVFRRESDTLLRLGGEEFAVLMHNTSHNNAYVLAENFRKALSEHDMPIGEQSIRITSSLGVGCMEIELDSSPNQFVRRIDEALYQAKFNGRNCTVMSSPKRPQKPDTAERNHEPA